MMERQEIFNYIEEKLSFLAYRIEVRGAFNLLDLHVHSENFYRDFLNLLYGYELVNLNTNQANVTAIDLVDEKNKLIVQVSATKTKRKINHSLAGIDSGKYKDFTFKFVLIARDANGLRAASFDVPQRIQFDPKSGIYDVTSLLKYIQDLPLDELVKVYEFIRKELGHVNEQGTIDSDLTKVILILSRENLSADLGVRVDNEFEIVEKIEYNSLTDESKELIQDLCIHQSRVDKIYSSFDKEGFNTSLFVLNKIRGIYRAYESGLQGNALFQKIRECVKQEIYNSPNRSDLSGDAIDYCADIIVVDAFIRCKIFENPQGYRDVTA